MERLLFKLTFFFSTRQCCRKHFGWQTTNY